MGSSVVVRKIAEYDIPTILEMQQELDDYHAELRPDLYRKGFCNLTDTDLRNANKIIYVATVNSKVIGYIVATKASYNVRSSKSDLFMHIEWLFIKELFRGQGVGTLLMKRTFEDAKLMGINRVTFNVLNGNPAIKMYEKLGATVVSSQMEIKI